MTQTYMGMVYLDREMYRDARSFFHATIATAPGFAEAYYQLGRAFALDEREADARSAWRAGYGANRFSPWGKRCLEAADAKEIRTDINPPAPAVVQG